MDITDIKKQETYHLDNISASTNIQKDKNIVQKSNGYI